MKTKITLSNDFHNTSASVFLKKITDGRFAGKYKLSASQAKRLKSRLCPHKDCKCGGVFGQRGGFNLDVINMDYDNNHIIDLANSQ